MFLFARTLPGRRIERFVNRAGYRQPLPAPVSLLNGVDLDRVVEEIIDDGVSLGLQLPDWIVGDIVAFAQSSYCFSRDRPLEGFLPRNVAEVNRTRDRDVVAGYYFETVERSAAIAQLGRDAALLNIARAYIGGEPILIRTRLWWSFPAIRVSDADLHAAAQEKFHFDMNDWRTLKFFFYLTPTNETGGAHQCIVGTHRRRPIRHQLSATVGRETEELERCFGKDRFLTITGGAGSGFAEDPFLFHTGSLCREQPRLILELEYGSSPVGPSYRFGRFG